MIPGVGKSMWWWDGVSQTRGLVGEICQDLHKTSKVMYDEDSSESKVYLGNRKQKVH